MILGISLGSYLHLFQEEVIFHHIIYYLHSSIDECGLNLAALLSKIMGEFSSQVSLVNI